MAINSFTCRPAGNGGIEIGLVNKKGNLRTIGVPPDRLSEVLATIVTSMTDAAPASGQAQKAGPIAPLRIVEPSAFGIGHAADGTVGFLVHFGKARLGIALPSRRLADIGHALISASLSAGEA